MQYKSVAKSAAILLILTCVLVPLCSCKQAVSTSGSGKLKIITTIFPLYDWALNIAGDNAEIEMLVDNGIDPHSFQPSVDDIVAVSDCDLLIFVGGQSDSWLRESLESLKSKNIENIDIFTLLGKEIKQEETVSGMQSEEDDDEAEEFDEHVWLSLKFAEKICDYIAEKLAEIDPDNSGVYYSNAAAYTEKLAKLDKDYFQTISSAANNVLLFADRFPFRYLTDDYGIEYYAAFPGCSAETEASFETLMFLINKTDELGLKYILQTETSDGSLAQTVKNGSKTKDQSIITLNSLQTVTYRQAADGTTYLSCMEQNLEIIKKALN